MSPSQIQELSSSDGGTSAASSTSYPKFTDDVIGFTFSLPTSWKLQSDIPIVDKDTGFYGRDFDFSYYDEEALIACWADNGCPYNDIEEFAESWVESMSNEYSNYARSMETLPSGCYLREETSTIQVNYYTIKNDFLFQYKFTSLASDDQSEDHCFGDFETMVANINICRHKCESLALPILLKLSFIQRTKSEY